MKKLVVISIVAAALTLFGNAGAQSAAGQGSSQASVSHGLEISIPSLLMIRFTEDVSSTGVMLGSPDAVEFSWGTADFEPEGTFPPTNEPSWGDIKVFSNGGWSLNVSVSNGDFDWSQVSVLAADGGVRFTLPSSDTAPVSPVLLDQARTAGWLSLGIAPSDYRLTLLGTEDADDYSTLVLYTIANP